MLSGSRYAPATRPPSLVREWAEAFRRRCQSGRIRLTPQRLAVYETLARDPHHPSAELLHRRLRKKFPSLSLATVYRILEAFERQGFIRRVHTSETTSRYDANLEFHQHLVCRRCGKIEDALIRDLPVALLAKGSHHFKVEAVSIHLEGLCRDCRTERRP